MNGLQSHSVLDTMVFTTSLTTKTGKIVSSNTTTAPNATASNKSDATRRMRPHISKATAPSEAKKTFKSLKKRGYLGNGPETGGRTSS